MNDPGLDDTITDAATQAHSTVGALKDNENKLNKAQEEEDAASAMPTRWWYASTAFPLIAGTFGPMANAFSINALVENWRVEIPPGGTEEHGIDIKDPRWLIAINAVSLGFALLANLSLLLNMAKRVRFEIAQPITILGFWVASVLLIGLISYTSTTAFDPPNVPDHALTQAYYYAIFAAAMYQIISYLMCFTVWGAYKGAYSKDFELTVAQRTLMLQTISFLVYLQIGALIYSKVEKWKYLDSVYFMNFTLLTVGIGDYSPSTHTGRSLLFPIAVGGIITIGLVVSSLRTLLLERGSEKMSARVTEKTRRRVIKQVEAMARRGKPLKKPMFGLKDNTVKDLAQDPQQDHTDELERRKLEFEAMRTVQDLAAKEKQYLGLTLSVTAFAILWFVGAVVFWEAEKNQQWSYFASLYFSYTSILTIGYGDLYPMSNSGKPFFVLWSLLAVPTLTILISNMGDTVVKGVKDATIWLGEISVLPSSESRMRDRLTRGLNRGGLKSLKFVKAKDDEEDKTEDQDEADEEWSDMKQLHPGLIQIFSATDRSRVSPRDIKVLDRLAAAWSTSEVEDEQAAQERQDDLAEGTYMPLCDLTIANSRS